MAATADLNIIRRAAMIASFPVNGGSEIFAGTLVTLDTDGQARAGADTEGFTFVGVAREGVDNTAGADGDKTVEVEQDGAFLLTGSGFSAASVGQDVYLIDDATIGLANHASVDEYIKVGTIIEYVSATQVWVKVTPGGGPMGKFGQWTVEVAGANAAALDLAAAAEAFGGADFYVESVQAVTAFVTSTGAPATVARKVVTTHWTLASGVISCVGDESANTLRITFAGYLTPSSVS